ncbi:MAG: hypothetical protein HYV51_02760 [Parcubacteria group bacterium]|nr:hypothetical protein [Parcubacteria group bacterium]
MGEKIINIGENLKKELPTEPKIEVAVEESESEPLQITAETILREVIKKEIVSKIQENFKKRNLTEELPAEEEKSEKRAALEFEYLRHNLLLSNILDKVTERGILGSVKKDWHIIMEEIRGELSQLAPESQAAVEEAIEEMFQKRQKIEEHLRNIESDEIFSELIGDGKKHRPKGTVSAKTLGDILTVYLPNKLDFAKVYSQSAAVSEENIKESSKVGGFTHNRRFKELGDVDVIVFPGSAYKSMLSHEVAHRISYRLFEENAPSIQEVKRSEYSEPRRLLDDVFIFWTTNKLKDELWNLTLEGLMHYDNSPEKNVEKILSKHTDFLLKQEKKGLYDYPEQENPGILKKLKELFPEEDSESLENLYQEYSSRYYEFAAHQVDFVKKQMSELKIQWMRYDFLNLLRFEDIWKWQRVPRFLKTIGKNFDALKEKWGFDSESVIRALNEKRFCSKDEFFGQYAYWGYNLDSVEALMKADDTTRAFVLLQWANYISKQRKGALNQ